MTAANCFRSVTERPRCSVMVILNDSEEVSFCKDDSTYKTFISELKEKGWSGSHVAFRIDAIVGFEFPE